MDVTKNTRYTKFGKYHLDLKPLLAKNQFRLVYKDGTMVRGFKKRIISDSFKYLLIELASKDIIDDDLYINLNPEEKVLFDDWLMLSNLNTKMAGNILKHKHYANARLQKDLKRFEILQGEVIAGNNNPDVIKELKMLLLKLIDDGAIESKEAMRSMRIITMLF